MNEIKNEMIERMNEKEDYNFLTQYISFHNLLFDWFIYYR